MRTSRATDRVAQGSRARNAGAGFVMVEMMLALTILALLAALALPLFSTQRGTALLRTKTVEVATLLRSARNSALLSGETVAVTLDADARAVLSGRSVVGIPDTLAIDMLPASQGGLLFFADGRSSGGGLSVRSSSQALRIVVNSRTATVDIAR
ncbi:GspH/FimT family pseudopilin [Mesorhizobium sp. CAU 1741]|uniref:GspH/FimT family pseudopilin n=1 Tax=Mesorhizobium sp. CAU 1741 TaxID=3140366 RepID=UPI00325B6C89